MNAPELLKIANDRRVSITLDNGRLFAEGDPQACRSILPLLRARKAELLALLAADAGYSRAEAERLAQQMHSGHAPALDSADQTKVNEWLDAIGETDEAARAEYLAICASDPHALHWTLGQITTTIPPPLTSAIDLS